MNDVTTAACPRIEEISALLDRALPARAAQEIEAHAAHCPLCAPVLREFSVISTRLQALREIRCDVDLAAIVRPQLPPRVPDRRKRPARQWGDLWQLAPRGLGAAVAVGAGAYLGLLLMAGGGTALRPAGMAVFDAVPPGAVCAGLPLCAPRGR